jgi:hypothetical protein
MSGVPLQLNGDQAYSKPLADSKADELKKMVNSELYSKVYQPRPAYFFVYCSRWRPLCARALKYSPITDSSYRSEGAGDDAPEG